MNTPTFTSYPYPTGFGSRPTKPVIAEYRQSIIRAILDAAEGLEDCLTPYISTECSFRNGTSTCN